MADITTFTRDEHRDRYLRFYRLRSPQADVGPGGEPYALASADADSCTVLYGDAITIARNVNLVDSTGEDLLKKAAARGVTGKLPATGAEGFVVVTAALGGGTVPAGTELRHRPTGLRFSVLATDIYETGDLCPIQGVDTGTATNLPTGTVLQWTSPPAGIADTAVIFDDLQGGHPEETDGELVQRLITLQTEPPASGNDAAIREAARKTRNVPVAGAWSYPAIFGPGTTCVVATLRTSTPLASRIPNMAQIAQIEANIKVQVPYDDGIFVAILQASPVNLRAGITWTKAATGWTDGAAAWPPYVAAGPVKVALAGATPTTFRLVAGSVITDPQPGQTIGFYDGTAGRFRRKRILSVASVVAGTTWDITCDTTANASDVSFAPALNAAASPWSDSLDSLVAPFAAYFQSLGPGEQFGFFVDPGARQRRQPESPDTSPNVISSRDLGGSAPRSLVSDIEILQPATPFQTPIGTPGVLSYLLTLGDLAVYVQT